MKSIMITARTKGKNPCSGYVAEAYRRSDGHWLARMEYDSVGFTYANAARERDEFGPAMEDIAEAVRRFCRASDAGRNLARRYSSACGRYWLEAEEYDWGEGDRDDVIPSDAVELGE